MDPYLFTAGLAALGTCAVHTFVGGAYIARPLLDAGDLRRVPKYTTYFCWHLVTLTLFAISAALMWASYSPDAVELAWFALFLTSSFLVWGVALIIGHKQSFKDMPQWALFLLILIPGYIGVLG